MIFIARYARDAEHAIRMSGIRFARRPTIITTEDYSHSIYGRRLDPENVILVECTRGWEHTWQAGRFAPDIREYLEAHSTGLDRCNVFVLP